MNAAFSRTGWFFRNSAAVSMQEVAETSGMILRLRVQVKEARFEQQYKQTRNAVLQATRQKQAAEIQKVSERCHLLQDRCQSTEDSTIGVNCIQVLPLM